MTGAKMITQMNKYSNFSRNVIFIYFEYQMHQSILLTEVIIYVKYQFIKKLKLSFLKHCI